MHLVAHTTNPQSLNVIQRRIMLNVLLLQQLIESPSHRQEHAQRYGSVKGRNAHDGEEERRGEGMVVHNAGGEDDGVEWSDVGGEEGRHCRAGQQVSQLC